MKHSTTIFVRLKGRTYAQTHEGSIPPAVRFDVPGRFQGQAIEYAFGGYDRCEHDVGDKYLRISDRSVRTVTYYRLIEDA